MLPAEHILRNSVLQFLNFVAIREIDGSYTVLKNRFTGEMKYPNREALIENIKPWVEQND